MECSGGCLYWAHAGKLSTGNVLRAVRLCLFFSYCFAHHAGAFLGGVGVRGGIHRAATRASRQAGRLGWRHRGSLAARRVVGCQEPQLAASTHSRACRAHCLRTSWALLGRAVCDEKASDSGTTQVSTITTATAKAAVPSAAPAAATVAAPATTRATANSTAPSFLAAVEEKTNRNNAGEVVLYFAFGANMSPSVLTGKRGVTPVKSAPAQAVTFATSDERKKQNLKHGRKIIASPAECEQDEAGKDGEDGEGRICLSFSHRAGMCVSFSFDWPDLCIRCTILAL